MEYLFRNRFQCSHQHKYTCSYSHYQYNCHTNMGWINSRWYLFNKLLLLLTFYGLAWVAFKIFKLKNIGNCFYRTNKYVVYLYTIVINVIIYCFACTIMFKIYIWFNTFGHDKTWIATKSTFQRQNQIIWLWFIFTTVKTTNFTNIIYVKVLSCMITVDIC